MIRYTLVILLGLCSAGGAVAASWADTMFEELSKDFGSVPRGPTLSHPFRVTNNTNNAVHIASVRVSCGCTSASASQHDVAPGQSTAIVAQMDTRRFYGHKAVTIYVQFDRPYWEEVRLVVQANARDDVTLSPESLAFGQVKRGTVASASLNITFLNNSETAITAVNSDSNYVQPILKEIKREGAEVSYQLTARVRRDTPVGKWYTDIWINTNSDATPRVRVPLTIEIEPALSVSPSPVALGEVKSGASTEQKVIVRGSAPFRILSVRGTDAQLNVRQLTSDAKAVHVLAVTLKAGPAGEVDRRIRVLTDLPEDSEIDFQARAQVTP